MEDKKRYASVLLCNTTDKNLKVFITEYLQALSIGIKTGQDKKILRFDNCIEYLVKNNFDVTGWQLWGIPIFYSHCFLNPITRQAFDLAVWDIGTVEVRYLDGSACEQKAESIEEAIQKYDMYDYHMSIACRISYKICEYREVDRKHLMKCLYKLISEGMPLIYDELILCDVPVEGVYVFSGKTTKGQDVAFDIEYSKGVEEIKLCLTIDSEVHYYDSVSLMVQDWHKHDLIKLSQKV